ncbi:hypothetical protein [Streptomyces sp. NPDC050982]|uniref:hypothetical protein n=1 Tax=Streptomyces sp. NPDC050982 TaxID=3154746 RepID=UPI0033F967E4
MRETFGPIREIFSARFRGSSPPAPCPCSTRRRIEDAGDWSFQLLPVEQAQPLTGSVEGAGSTVLGCTGPPALIGLRRTTGDDGRPDSWTVQPEGRRAVCADTAGRRRPVTGPLWVSEAGYCFLLVQAGDETGRRLDPAPLDTTPVFGGQGRQVSGQGCGVVRHTGPETEMMLTHEGRGMLDLLVIRELGERLRPVRRISTASGLQRLPGGFLQIRTSGNWTIENHG